MLYFTNNYKEMESNTSKFEKDWILFVFFIFRQTFQLTLFDLQFWFISFLLSGGSRGGARGALAPAEIWLAPEVPLSCHSSVIYVSVKSFEIQPVQRKLYM